MKEDPPWLHPSARLGLLRYITESSMDADYEALASRPPGKPMSRRGLAAAVIALAFGFLVTLSAAQTSQGEAAAEAGRDDLVAQLTDGHADLKEKQQVIASLQAQVEGLRAKVLGSTDLSQRTRTDLQRLGLAAGTTQVHGEGLVITVDDAPGAEQDRDRVLDIDLQRLANGLWEAGAEAISINGQRLGPLSAIRQAGVAITVNYKSLERPYTIRVIGDQRTLPSRFAETASGRAWLDLQRRVNLEFAMNTSDNVYVPALPTPQLRHARPVKEATS